MTILEMAKKFENPVEITEEQYKAAQETKEKDFFDAHYSSCIETVTVSNNGETIERQEVPRYYFVPEVSEKELHFNLLNNMEGYQKTTAKYAKIIGALVILSFALNTIGGIIILSQLAQLASIF